METGETSIGPGTRAPRRRTGPAPARTGSVEVTVMLKAVCWDTFAEDGTSGDRTFDGVTVRMSPASGAVQEATTSAGGWARFDDVPVGSVIVRAEKTDYRSEYGMVTVAAGATASATLTMHSLHNECTRPHLAKPAGTPGTTTLGPIFWTSQPWILFIRDLLWLATLIASVVLIPVALLVPAAGQLLGLGILCLGICAYATHVTFGMIPGVVTMVAAFASFLVLAVFTVLALLTTPPLPVMNAVTDTLGMPPPQVYFFPSLCAMWIAFAIGLAAGRREMFNFYTWGVVIVAIIVGAVVAVVVFLVMYFFYDPAGFSTQGWWAILQLVVGAIAALFGGLMSHVFVNDGQMDSPRWGLTDLELPYAGERYCVQGHRGYISHFVRRWSEADSNGVMQNYTSDEEYSYDWSLPEGEPILAAREGHIIAFKEDKTGNQMFDGNKTANYVYVRHRDGTVAHYLHIRLRGFTEFNAAVAALGTAAGAGNRAHFTIADPVHCHAGQRLAATGNVGVSMFDHLHFAVKRAAPDAGREDMPLKFQDADAQRHEGRCFSMRKYRSSNVDRGPVTLP
jgi:hypothetical protein